MPDTTANYGLIKPLESEFYDVAVFNGNADKIDAALKEVDNGVATKIRDAVGVAIGGTY